MVKARIASGITSAGLPVFLPSRRVVPMEAETLIRVRANAVELGQGLLTKTCYATSSSECLRLHAEVVIPARVYLDSGPSGESLRHPHHRLPPGIPP